MNQEIGKTEPIIGRSIDALDTPALVVDADMLDANIKLMANLVANAPGRIRPHCKTHKSARLARQQIAAGAQGVCCAKLSEALAIAGERVDDIMITTPIVGRPKLHGLNSLLKLAKVSAIVDDARGLEGIGTTAEAAKSTIDVVIEVDVGQGRCGVPPGPAARDLAQQIVRFPKLRFKGLHGYQGKLQMTADWQERREAVNRALNLLLESAETVRKAGFEIEVLTGGGTGSIGIDISLGGLNEYQPGSYVFMDASYRRVIWDADGGMIPFKCALTVLSTVVSRPSNDRAIVDVGWKSASMDSGPPIPVNDRLVFEFAGDEHGCIRRRDGLALDLQLGEYVPLIPSHCDTTVNHYSRYFVTRGGVVTDIWPVDARGRSQ